MHWFQKSVANTALPPFNSSDGGSCLFLDTMMRSEQGSWFFSFFPSLFFTSLVSSFATPCLFCCRSAASFRRASASKRFVASPEMGNDNKDTEELGPSDPKLEDNTQRDQGQNSASWFPVWDLFNHPWSNKRQEPQNRSNARYIHIGSCWYLLWGIAILHSSAILWCFLS